MTTIRLDGVSRSFGAVRAVDNVSVTIEEGKLFTLLGPSGCGKTTLLRMIAGFVELEAGSIWFDGKRIDALPAHHRNTGMVFQNYAIFPNLTVEGNVAYGLRARKIDPARISARVDKALERVRLEGYGPRWPHQLSGGQLQRVAIARVLVVEPSVLLFDEPLSNLDAQLRTQMRVEIRQLQQSLGLTTIYVTHDQEEALAISDRIAILRSGRIEQVGSPEDIYQRPGTAFVAEFLGGTNMLPGVAGTFDGHTTEVASCGTTISVNGKAGNTGQKVFVSIRPEALRVARDSEVPVLRAKLVLREFLGQIQRLHAALPDGTQIRVSTLSSFQIAAKAGTELAFAYDPAQIVVYPGP